MKRVRGLMYLLALPVVLVTLTFGQQPASPERADHLQAMRWMAGRTWTAEAVDPAGKKTHIESVVSKSQNGSNIEFTVSFDGKPQYNGFYTWDPAAKQIRFWYTSSEGELTQGSVEPEGDALLHKFTITDVDGKVTPLRSHVKPVSADAYDWNVEVDQGGKWVELFHLRYTRKA